MSSENPDISLSVASIIEEIKASQQNLLKVFEEHQTFVNNALEKLQQLKTESKVEVVKVKDPLEEIKRLKKCIDEKRYGEDQFTDIHKMIGFLTNIFNILSLYGTNKISVSFKDIFIYIFKKCISENDPINSIMYHFKDQLKKKFLKVRDIRWLLLEMEYYPYIFKFTEEDLEVLKENGASRDNIYLVKKFLKKDGDYEEYFSEEEGGGIKFKYHMIGGKLEGEYKIWHKNGTLYCQEYYKEGKKEGESKRWNHDGQLRFQGYYKDDERENEYKSWRPTGQLLEHMIYNKDGTDEYKMWYENEQIWMHMYSKGDNREGEYKRWYENGQLMVQKFYKDGKEEGEYKKWHPNGQLEFQCYCKEGKLEGEYKCWSEDGTLKEKLIYKDGEKQV